MCSLLEMYGPHNRENELYPDEDGLGEKPPNQYALCEWKMKTK